MGPAEYDDGLLENKPAVVNTASSFSFYLKADEYDFDETYSLELNLVDTTDNVTTTLIVSQYTTPDTVFIEFYSGDSILTYMIAGKAYYSRVDAATDFYPTRVHVWGKSFTGLLELNLLAGDLEEEPEIPGEVNVPMVISTENNYHYYLTAEDYTDSTTQAIDLYYNPLTPTANIFTHLIVTGFSGPDTSYIALYNAADSLIKRYDITSDVSVSATDLSMDYQPVAFELVGDSLSGVINFLITK